MAKHLFTFRTEGLVERSPEWACGGVKHRENRFQICNDLPFVASQSNHKRKINTNQDTERLF